MTSKRTRDQRRENGLCIDCGDKALDDQCRCKNCRDRLLKSGSNRRVKFQELGLCVKCGKSKPEGDHTKCNECLDSQMKAYRKRLESHKTENRQCLDCGEPTVPNGGRCRVCYVKRVSVKRTGSVKNWELLDDKFDKQNGVCPYTGRSLMIGVDADLDHIKPSSCGGTNDLENFQWIFHKANQMKWNYPEEEFLGLVKEIYLHRFGVAI